MPPCNVGVMRMFNDVTVWPHHYDVILLSLGNELHSFREEVACF
jgi:hypothetical protein